MRELNKDNFEIKFLNFKETNFDSPGLKVLYESSDDSGTIVLSTYTQEDNQKKKKNIIAGDFNIKVYQLIKTWKKKYNLDSDICDGVIWNLKIELKDNTIYKFSGHQSFPENYELFVKFINSFFTCNC